MPRKSTPKPTVSISAPSIARLTIPRGLGEVRSTPSPPAPVEPVQTPKSRQLAPTARVIVTNPRGAA